MFSKYILTKKFRLIVFNKMVDNMAVAEYGWYSDRNTIIFRSLFEIMNKKDLLYFGRIRNA